MSFHCSGSHGLRLIPDHACHAAAAAAAVQLERSGVYHPPSHTFVDPAIVGKQVNGCDMSLTGKRSDGLV